MSSRLVTIFQPLSVWMSRRYRHQGTVTESDITLFVGTGVDLQALAVASVAVDLALQKNQAQKVSLKNSLPFYLLG